MTRTHLLSAIEVRLRGDPSETPGVPVDVDRGPGGISTNRGVV